MGHLHAHGLAALHCVHHRAATVCLGAFQRVLAFTCGLALAGARELHAQRVAAALHAGLFAVALRRRRHLVSRSLLGREAGLRNDGRPASASGHAHVHALRGHQGFHLLALFDRHRGELFLHARHALGHARVAALHRHAVFPQAGRKLLRPGGGTDQQSRHSDHVQGNEGRSIHQELHFGLSLAAPPSNTRSAIACASGAPSAQPATTKRPRWAWLSMARPAAEPGLPAAVRC